MTSRILAGRVPLLVAMLALLCAGAAVSALTAAPAHAFTTWEHDGATACSDCHATGPSDASCTACHGSDFKSVPGDTCWSCHQPGQDTSAWRTSAGCSSTCHLWNESQRAYSIEFSHGATPHLGADFAPCTTCHGVSTGFSSPDGSPHHAGMTLTAPACQDCHNGTLASQKANHDSVKPACTSCHNGMDIPVQPATCNKCHAAKTYGTNTCTDCHSATGIFQRETVHTTSPAVGACTTCHTGLQKHAGRVACTTCHTKAKQFHHGVTRSPGFPACTKCHTMSHATWRIPATKCASCHRGTNAAAGNAIVHSRRVTHAAVACRRCHALQVHASGRGSGLTCGTCHGSAFHGRKIVPSSSSCVRCHGSATAHAVGLPCLLCHRSAVHNAFPTAGGLIN